MKVKQLIDILKGFNENDFIVIQSTEKNGDEIDLHDFTVDWVGGLISDDTTIKEIRLVQQHN